MPGFDQQVREVHPNVDLRWVGKPLEKLSGYYKAKFMHDRVVNSRVQPGSFYEARRCLCTDRKAHNDSALYRVEMEVNNDPIAQSPQAKLAKSSKGASHTGSQSHTKKTHSKSPHAESGDASHRQPVSSHDENITITEPSGE